eukprot:519474-Hanusia_phi.AAC.1
MGDEAVGEEGSGAVVFHLLHLTFEHANLFVQRCDFRLRRSEVAQRDETKEQEEVGGGRSREKVGGGRRRRRRE